MAARATTMKEFRVWHWVWKEKAFEIRRAKDEATLREKLPRRLADRLIEIEELDVEEPEEPEIPTLPIGTVVILANGAHGVVFGHFRREDGSTWLRVTHPDYWAQRRKWDVPECRNYPPAWDCVAQSSVTVPVVQIPVWTEVIMPNGAHWSVIGRWRRKDGMPDDVFVASRKNLSSGRKLHLLTHSEVTVVTTPENGDQ